MKNIQRVIEQIENNIRFFKSNKVLNFVKGIFWAIFGEVIGRGSSLLAIFFASQMLGAIGFGQFNMIKSTIGVLSVISGLGLSITTTYSVAKYFRNELKITGEIIALCNVVAISIGIVIATLLFLLAEPIAEHILLDVNLKNALRIGSITVLIGSIIGVASGALAGFGNFRDLAFISLLEGVLTLISTVCLIYKYEVEGAILGIVISQLVKLLVIHYKFKKCCNSFKIVIDYSNLKRHINILWAYSIPAFLCAFMYGPAIWLLNLIMISQPDGYKVLGVISAADQWKTIVIFVPGAFGTFFFPLLANLRSSSPHASYIRSAIINIFSQLMIALIIAIPIVLLKSIIVSFYGATYEDLSLVIPIIALTAVFQVIGNAGGNALMTNSNIWPNFLINLIWAILLVGFGYVLIGKYGLIGVAYSYLFATLVHSALVLYMSIYSKSQVIKS